MYSFLLYYIFILEAMKHISFDTHILNYIPSIYWFWIQNEMRASNYKVLICAQNRLSTFSNLDAFENKLDHFKIFSSLQRHSTLWKPWPQWCQLAQQHSIPKSWGSSSILAGIMGGQPLYTGPLIWNITSAAWNLFEREGTWGNKYNMDVYGKCSKNVISI